MGVFDSFGDIDNTKEGHVYVVDSNGWGWFALFILMALPFFMLSLLLYRYANAVCQHPFAAALIYGAICLIVSFWLYHGKDTRFRFIGIIATILSMLPLAAVQAVYAIPYILTHDGFFGIAFEWLLVSLTTLGITFFVLSLGHLCRNGIIHLILSVIFMIAVAMVLEPPDGLSWEYILQLYNLH